MNKVVRELPRSGAVNPVEPPRNQGPEGMRWCSRCHLQLLSYVNQIDQDHIIFICNRAAVFRLCRTAEYGNWKSSLFRACWRSNKLETKYGRPLLNVRRRCSKIMRISDDWYSFHLSSLAGQLPNILSFSSPRRSGPISRYDLTASSKASQKEPHRDLYQKEFSAQRRNAWRCQLNKNEGWGWVEW